MIRRGVNRFEIIAVLAAVVALGGLAAMWLLSVLGLDQTKAEVLPQRKNVAAPRSSAARNDSSPYIGLGAGGCATARCHGGARSLDAQGNPQSGDEWKTSAFVFLQQDPHA